MAARSMSVSALHAAGSMSSLTNSMRWTCRTCARQRTAPMLPRTFPAGGLVQRTFYNGPARRVEVPLSQGGAVLTGQDAGSGRRGSRQKTKSRGPRRALYAVTGAGVLASAVALSDDARHYAEAAQRTGRVVGTLAVNINDYRRTLKEEENLEPEQWSTVLKACHKRCAERTLVTLEKNGSIFIKLGQHLSSLTYLLPNEWCETFIPLQDKCPVSSYDSIRAMILTDTGQPLEAFFSAFEEEPIGAASLAQVHRAVLRDTGESVAVKVQHPVLDEWAPLDLALTRFTFVQLKNWFPEYDLTWLSKEMELSLPQELDFDSEGKNAMHTREYFSHVPNVPLIIPRVIWSKRRILVMEYVTGHRPDDLEYLDAHHIDRDEVSAMLARIFDEMIFGTGAPLHCDPHGGNIAIRHNPNRTRKANFDIVLYDHGLYRELPLELRRSYAKLWLAVLDNDLPRMRTHAYDVAGISDSDFELFASAITGRDYSVFMEEGGGIQKPRNMQEKRAVTDALGEGLLAQICGLLGRVPRILLLILKTNDLTRSLDEGLHTRQGSARTFLILAQYASRTVYEESVERISGSMLAPRNWIAFLRAWVAYKRIELRLGLFEGWLTVRSVLGLSPMALVA